MLLYFLLLSPFDYSSVILGLGIRGLGPSTLGLYPFGLGPLTKSGFLGTICSTCGLGCYLVFSK